MDLNLYYLKSLKKIVGYRFGEFVPTRKVTIHKEAKKKNNTPHITP